MGLPDQRSGVVVKEGVLTCMQDVPVSMTGEKCPIRVAKMASTINEKQICYADRYNWSQF